jgi:hypothetical protein
MRLINLWARVAARFFGGEATWMNDTQRLRAMEKVLLLIGCPPTFYGAGSFKNGVHLFFE